MKMKWHENRWCSVATHCCVNVKCVCYMVRSVYLWLRHHHHHHKHEQLSITQINAPDMSEAVIINVYRNEVDDFFVWQVVQHYNVLYVNNNSLQCSSSIFFSLMWATIHRHRIRVYVRIAYYDDYVTCSVISIQFHLSTHHSYSWLGHHLSLFHSTVVHVLLTAGHANQTYALCVYCYCLWHRE